MNPRLISTSKAGILQSRAYRNLHKFTSMRLEKYELSMAEWGLLGGLINKPRPMSDIADEMDYELSHVSNIATTLEQRELLERIAHRDDRRQKSLQLTESGRQLAENVEKHLRSDMRKWLSDLDFQELLTYMATVRVIAEKKPE